MFDISLRPPYLSPTYLLSSLFSLSCSPLFCFFNYARSLPTPPSPLYLPPFHFFVFLFHLHLAILRFARNILPLSTNNSCAFSNKSCLVYEPNSMNSWFWFDWMVSYWLDCAISDVPHILEFSVFCFFLHCVPFASYWQTLWIDNCLKWLPLCNCALHI